MVSKKLTNLYFQLRRDYDLQDLKITKNGFSYFRPLTLEKLIKLKNLYPEGRIIVGNTEVGKFKKFNLLNIKNKKILGMNNY